MSAPEHWLRGPIAGIEPLLQPVAHALRQALDDVEGAIAGLTPDEIGLGPGGAASLAFHLRHLAGSTDRLFTYARGESLSGAQREALRAEEAREATPDAGALLAGVRATIDRALAQLRATPASALLSPREVGRARLPSTVLGLLFHAAEHAQRHTGQIVATAKIVRGMRGATR
ncbi:MAG TPA: DinB family protein [Gemmatimonadaceae bacterium]|nr:DinB family protein [Gemmatimonadaceae bacterium]